MGEGCVSYLVFPSLTRRIFFAFSTSLTKVKLTSSSTPVLADTEHWQWLSAGQREGELCLALCFSYSPMLAGNLFPLPKPLFSHIQCPGYRDHKFCWSLATSNMKKNLAFARMKEELMVRPQRNGRDFNYCPDPLGI